MIQNEFKMIFNAFRFRSRTLSMFSNALKIICNAFDRFQNALKWKNGSTDFSLSLVFPNRVTFFQLRDNVLFSELCLYKKIWYMLHCNTLDFSPVLTTCITKVTYHRITLKLIFEYPDICFTYVLLFVPAYFPFSFFADFRNDQR